MSPYLKNKNGNSELLVIIAIAVILVIGGLIFTHRHKPVVVSNQNQTIKQACTGNELANYVVVSISQRQMWACSKTTQVYDSAVITGRQNLPFELTPTGTYQIYAKTTNTTLSGSDSTGSWSDPVFYWLPFFDNQYGTYGFHDATWRKANEFGSTSPYATSASHGCVEMPLAAAKWLYDWAPVGTTVKIES